MSFVYYVYNTHIYLSLIFILIEKVLLSANMCISVYNKYTKLWAHSIHHYDTKSFSIFISFNVHTAVSHSHSLMILYCVFRCISVIIKKKSKSFLLSFIYYSSISIKEVQKTKRLIDDDEENIYIKMFWWWISLSSSWH